MTQQFDFAPPGASQPTYRRGVAVPRSALRPNPWNPNRMTDRQKAALQESLATYGQVLEVIVREHPEEPGAFQILDGEHRFRSDDDPNSEVVVTVVEGLSEAAARKMTIILNETRGRADDMSLAALLSELQGLDGINSIQDLQIGLPWEQVDLEYMLSLVQPNPGLTSEPGTPQEFTAGDGQTVDVGPVRFSVEMTQADYERARVLYGELQDRTGETPAGKWGRLFSALAAAATEPEEV